MGFTGFIEGAIIFMDPIVKAILIILFILCLFDMPYGYYQAVRFNGAVKFIILSYLSYQDKDDKNIETIIYLALALLFQPFIKIAFERTIWNVFDVLFSLGLVISIYLDGKSQKSTT